MHIGLKGNEVKLAISGADFSPLVGRQRGLKPKSTVKEWAKLISPNVQWSCSDFWHFWLFT